jgi:23S rRNA pseudouridine1911/1915/1917 synthase
MVVAKNDQAHADLAEQFKAGKVKKLYVAIIHGIIVGERGKFDLSMARHPRRRKEMSVTAKGGKRALTRWRKLEELAGKFSLISLAPKTGRTHQIRVHLAYAGHPILGDAVYGHGRNWWKRQILSKNPSFPMVGRQMLHAECLGFLHPSSQAYCEFQVPLPDDMAGLLNALRSVSQ